MSEMDHVAYISVVEENTKMDLREIGWKGVDQIHLIQDKV
jgi:hypothetical protein